MAIRRSTIFSDVELEPPKHRNRQSIKSSSILAAGFQRFRTLSGVSQHKRDNEPRPPLPIHAPISPSKRNLMILGRISSSEPKQQLSPSPVLLCNSPSLLDPIDSSPFIPCVSHLQGIHFVRDDNQDPNLDDESTASRPTSTPSQLSSTNSPAESSNSRLTCRTPSFSVTWSEQFTSSGRTSATVSEDSSCMSDTSLISQMIENIPPKLLSARAYHTASPPIDVESPYAPYAPTSPLSSSNASARQNPPHNTSTIPFNLRNAIRQTLPSIIPKGTGKTTMLHQRQMTQNQPAVRESSELQSHPSCSSFKAHSSKNFLVSDPTPLLTPGHELALDQCSSNLAYFSSVSGNIKGQTCQLEHETEKVRIAEEEGRHRRVSASVRVLSSIPFPCSQSHDDTEGASDPQPQRDRSQSSRSQFRNQLNNFWSHPISRLRTSSSLSTVIRGLKSGRRRDPSDASFGARPFSMRTDSSYEILDASAIPRM